LSFRDSRIENATRKLNSVLQIKNGLYRYMYKPLILLARPEGLEPPAYGFEVDSIQF